MPCGILRATLCELVARSNLAARESAHAGDPVLRDFDFQIEFRTDSYSEQRGLEQTLYDQNPQAMQVNGGFNKIRGISLTNSNVEPYMQAGNAYLAALGG
jgi:hypothetical protein